MKQRISHTKKRKRNATIMISSFYCLLIGPVSTIFFGVKHFLFVPDENWFFKSLICFIGGVILFGILQFLGNIAVKRHLVRLSQAKKR